MAIKALKQQHLGEGGNERKLDHQKILSLHYAKDADVYLPTATPDPLIVWGYAVVAPLDIDEDEEEGGGDEEEAEEEPFADEGGGGG